MEPLWKGPKPLLDAHRKDRQLALTGFSDGFSSSATMSVQAMGIQTNFRTGIKCTMQVKRQTHGNKSRHLGGLTVWSSELRDLCHE